jgi:hypothetical protein
MSRKVIQIVRRARLAWLALALLCGPAVAYADPDYSYGIEGGYQTGGCGACAAGCGTCSWPIHCGYYPFCLEGGPRIRYSCTCPKPVCPPCELQHWGYYETCWRAWPWPPDWSHCPVPPPSAHLEGQGLPVVTTPGRMPGAPMDGFPGRPGQPLPLPRPSNGL